jgi:protein farnesyltransferase subunit beta
MSTFNPSIFTLPFDPLPSNSHPSDTLEEQDETERLISQLLHTIAPPAPAGTELAGGTTLRKAEHAGYFQQLLFRLPPGFVSLDASKPWLMYWTLHSLDLLGIGLDQGTKDRCVDLARRS